MVHVQLNQTIELYLKRSEETVVSIPVGYYRLKVAKGKQWLGIRNYFGYQTVFFQTDYLLEIFHDYSIIYSLMNQEQFRSQQLKRVTSKNK